MAVSKKKKGIQVSPKIRFKKMRHSLFIPAFSAFVLKGSRVCFGLIGIQSIENGYLLANEIESTRVVLRKFLKLYRRLGTRIWIRVKPHILVTKKSKGVRMGKGKGAVYQKRVLVHPGQILFEIFTPRFIRILPILEVARSKLSVKTGIVLLNKAGVYLKNESITL